MWLMGHWSGRTFCGRRPGRRCFGSQRGGSQEDGTYDGGASPLEAAGVVPSHESIECGQHGGGIAKTHDGDEEITGIFP